LAAPTPERSAKRADIAGYLLAAMVLLACAHAIWPTAIPLWPSGICAWCAAALLLTRIGITQRALCGLLAALGVGGIIYARKLGIDVDLSEPLTRNQSLLTMLAAVSFLRLVTIGSTRAHSELPTGRRAFAKTLLGVGMFGAIINLSAPLLIADRINDAGRLDRFATRSITRIFSGCSGWSPFFGGMAVVITYVPEAKLGTLMLAGLPFAIIGGIWTFSIASMRDSDSVKKFTGYPMDLRNLWIPVLLASYVAAIYFAFDLPILICIAGGALLVTVSVLLFRYGLSRTLSTMHLHIRNGLSAMGSELLLFLAAGVLATGLSAAIASSDAIVEGPFDAVMAIYVLAGMLLAACIGLHPVILISMLASILAQTGPDPNLLAFTFLLGWSIGTSCSPLSGTHLIFQARYGVSSLQAAIQNWPFAGVMFIVAMGLITIFENVF